MLISIVYGLILLALALCGWLAYRYRRSLRDWGIRAVGGLYLCLALLLLPGCSYLMPLNDQQRADIIKEAMKSKSAGCFSLAGRAGGMLAVPMPGGSYGSGEMGLCWSEMKDSRVTLDGGKVTIETGIKVKDLDGATAPETKKTLP